MSIKQELLDSISDRAGELNDLLKGAYIESNYVGYARLVKEWRRLVELYDKIEMEGEDD